MRKEKKEERKKKLFHHSFLFLFTLLSHTTDDLKGLSDSVADSMRGLLSLPSLDSFDKGMLADEPRDKVAAAVAEARRIHGL